MATNGGLIQLGAETTRATTNLWKTTGEHIVYNLDVEGWNANNFPTRTPPANTVYQSGCYVWPPNLKPGNLVLKWDGKATWNANGQNFGSTTVSGGRKVLTPPAYLDYPGDPLKFGIAGNTSILFRVTGVGDVAPSNIRLCHEDDEADMDAGQVFNSEWLESVARLKPGILRWLNSPSGSGAFLSDFDHEAVEADNKWYGSKFLPANFVSSCTLDSGTQTFIAAKSGFSLTHGASVHIRIPTRPNTKVFYLNVEGTGAKLVRAYTGHDPNYASCPNDLTMPRAGGVSTFIYHADFDAWLIKGNIYGSAGTGQVGGYDVGLPLSAKVALCNTLGCDLWWNPPYIVCAPFHTPYFTDVFTYIRDNLNPGLKVWVEGPNETWNTRYWGFSASFYLAWTEGEKVGGTTLTNTRNNGYTVVGLEQGYGRFMSQMGEFLETFYGPQNKGVKYELICGFQTGSGVAYQATGKTLCSNYVNENPATNKPATNYITGFAFTNYHNSSTYANCGSAGTANATWQGWPYFLYYMEQYWNNFADPDAGYTAQELQNRRNAQLKAIRYITNGLMETRPYSVGTWYGSNYNEFMRTRINYMWNKYGKPTYYYEGGNSPDWFSVDFTVSYQGPDPEGVTRPTTTGRQTGSGIKYAEYLRATKYDPKLRWVEFYKLKQLTNIPNSYYPSRYLQSGDGGAWCSYDPDPSTVRYLTGQPYTASSLVWRYPNLKGPCESTKGFEDFSNGRFVMYAKTA